MLENEKAVKLILYLEIVWQLRASSVAGIHGNEHGAGGVQFELRPFKHQQLGMGSDSWIHTTDAVRCSCVFTRPLCLLRVKKKSAVSKHVHYQRLRIDQRAPVHGLFGCLLEMSAA